MSYLISNVLTCAMCLTNKKSKKLKSAFANQPLDDYSQVVGLSGGLESLRTLYKKLSDNQYVSEKVTLRVVREENVCVGVLVFFTSQGRTPSKPWGSAVQETQILT